MATCDHGAAPDRRVEALVLFFCVIAATLVPAAGGSPPGAVITPKPLVSVGRPVYSNFPTGPTASGRRLSRLPENMT